MTAKSQYGNARGTLKVGTTHMRGDSVKEAEDFRHHAAVGLRQSHSAQVTPA